MNKQGGLRSRQCWAGPGRGRLCKYLSKDPRKRECEVLGYLGRKYPERRKSGAKALRQECVWHIGGTATSPWDGAEEEGRAREQLGEVMGSPLS